MNLQWWDQKYSQTLLKVASALLKLMQVCAFWYHQSPGHRYACWIGRQTTLVFLVSLQPDKQEALIAVSQIENFHLAMPFHQSIDTDKQKMLMDFHIHSTDSGIIRMVNVRTTNRE